MMSLEHIRALAEEYATKYNPDNIAPFPYENILKDYPELSIYFTELEDEEVSGVILFKEGEYSILVNTSKPSTRQNFTVGHELGHYFLHKNTLKDEKGIIDGDATLDGPKILYRVNGAESQEMEIEANNFAASLIMPADLVRRAWEATNNIEKCARIFNVSVVAMSIRLTHLGLIAE